MIEILALLLFCNIILTISIIPPFMLIIPEIIEYMNKQIKEKFGYKEYYNKYKIEELGYTILKFLWLPFYLIFIGIIFVIKKTINKYIDRKFNKDG